MFFFHVQAVVCRHFPLSHGSLICIQYNIISLVFTWFAMANMWLTFSIVINLLPDQKIDLFGTATIVSHVLREILRLHLIICFRHIGLI